MTPGLARLVRQFDTAWKLAEYHLTGLTTEQCLWRPSSRGLHVHLLPDGRWFADWPERESYDIGPPSIAWITWHMGYWWSMVLDHSFGARTLVREQVEWPGDADGVRNCLGDLHGQWRSRLEALTDRDLESTERTAWPYTDRPFGDVVAWANIELTKNAAEVGYVRFLYAVRPAQGADG